uniref:C-type lectin domain-containing protein n=1 Tax=Strongyloides venezuelensis TaxID=75913 RepID=A0A0K0EV07_STRVS
MHIQIYLIVSFITIVISKNNEFITQTTTYEECSSNISNLYLDIAFVFDSSYGSDEQGFNGQLLSISGFLGKGFLIQQGAKTQSTRVSYITMANKVVTFSNLTTYNSVDEARSGLLDLSYYANKGPNENIYEGLMEAYNQLNDFGRDGYKKLIVLFTSFTKIDCDSEMSNGNSSNTKNPCRAADSIKGHNIDILIINLNYHDSPPPEIKHIASPNYDIPNDNNLLQNLIKLSTYSNCNCPSRYTQFGDVSINFKGRTCGYYEDTPTYYYVLTEKIKGDNSRLVEIRSERKQNFTKSLCGDDDCFFGLNQLKKKGQWEWDGSDTEFDPKEFDNFDPDQEKVDGCGYIGNATGKWYSTDCYNTEKSYIYEIIACDTENFCLF